MDARTLTQVMPGLSLDLAHKYAGPFTRSLELAGATTQRRAAMFIAQVGHESASLRYMREIADGSAYEGRHDLGNIHPGDGRKFRGRGIIQVTGRANTLAFSRWAHARGLVASPDALVRDPTPMERLPLSMLTASWYWSAARPQLNALSDAGDIEGATRAINGGLNGIDDRRSRYQRAMGMNLVGGNEKVKETILPYRRDQVRQDTIYNCGPASTQTVIRSKTNTLLSEAALGRELGTHTGGTDYIGQFPRVLNRHLAGAQYRHQDMPNDPPTGAQKEKLWRDLTNSISGGYGVIANFVVPPSNYPRAVYPSTISPSYGGGTVYHYVAVMGFAGSGSSRRVWIADSGFAPYGYWMSFDQFATCIPPKGYAYSSKPAAKPAARKKGNKVDKHQADRIERKLDLIMDQLVGPEKDRKGYKFTGWQQLGGKTLIDSIADIRNIIGKDSK